MPPSEAWRKPPADWCSPSSLLQLCASAICSARSPSGCILARFAGLGDLRQIGSGNIGATNVLRTGNKPLAALTLLLDAAEGHRRRAGWRRISARTRPCSAGLGAFLGHLFPVWLGFRGGKGVATYIGVLLGLYWPAALVFCAIWLFVAAVTRYSSLAALAARA